MLRDDLDNNTIGMQMIGNARERRMRLEFLQRINFLWERFPLTE